MFNFILDFGPNNYGLFGLVNNNGIPCFFQKLTKFPGPEYSKTRSLNWVNQKRYLYCYKVKILMNYLGFKLSFCLCSILRKSLIMPVHLTRPILYYGFRLTGNKLRLLTLSATTAATLY